MIQPTKEEIQAHNIVEKYYQLNNLNLPDQGTNHYISRILAKKCAIYEVEALIHYCQSDAGNPPNLQTNEFNKEFWIIVKQILTK